MDVMRFTKLHNRRRISSNMPLLSAWLYWVIKHLYSLALFLLDAAGVEEFILPFRRTFEYNYGWDIASDYDGVIFSSDRSLGGRIALHAHLRGSVSGSRQKNSAMLRTNSGNHQTNPFQRS